MILHRDGTADALLSADRPVLLERASSINGRLVGAGRDVDIVLSTVAGEAALVLGPAAGVVGSIRLNDVVLNKRVAGPAVDGKIAIAARVEGATIVDGPEKSAVPVQAPDKTYRPVPGFQPFPPTKLPVFLQFTEYRLPSPMVYWA